MNKKGNKRRLGNGDGGVHKLGGNRKYCYEARITTGYDDNGKQLYYSLGTETSYSRAFHFLELYWRNPNLYIAGKDFFKTNRIYRKNFYDFIDDWCNDKDISRYLPLSKFNQLKENTDINQLSNKIVDFNGIKCLTLNRDISSLGIEEKRKVTLFQVYVNAMEEKKQIRQENGKKLADNTFQLYETNIKHFSDYYNIPFVEFRKAQMKKVLDKVKGQDGSKAAIKTTYNQLYKYATSEDIPVEQNYAAWVEVNRKAKTTKTPFPEKEIELLWENVDKIVGVDDVLIMIYTGLRIAAYVDLLTSPINLEERSMIGGNKTEAGMNNLIPIHKKIIPLLEKKLKTAETYLVHDNNKKHMSTNYFKRNYFDKVMEALGLTHTPHETRHTFETRLNNVGANQATIDKIMGHSTGKISERYTHKDLTERLKAIDLLA